jgi:hypothetical protein
LKAGLVRRKGQIDVVRDGLAGGVLSEFGRALGLVSYARGRERSDSKDGTVVRQQAEEAAET